MRGLALTIFEHTKETRDLSNAGIDYDYEDCTQGEIIFYNINAICKEMDGDNVYTCIYCNGGQFVSPLSPGKVNELISDAYKNGLL